MSSERRAPPREVLGKKHASEPDASPPARFEPLMVAQHRGGRQNPKPTPAGIAPKIRRSATSHRDGSYEMKGGSGRSPRPPGSAAPPRIGWSRPPARFLPKPLTSKELNRATKVLRALLTVPHHEKTQSPVPPALAVDRILHGPSCSHRSPSRARRTGPIRTANRDRYLRDDIRRGARKITVLAHVEYGLRARSGEGGRQGWSRGEHLQARASLRPGLLGRVLRARAS